MLSRLSFSSLGGVLPVHARVCSRGFRGCHALESMPLPQHVSSENNRPDMPWDFSTENKPKVEEILSRFPKNYKASAIIPLLWLAQKQNQNWIPLAAMNRIAEIVGQAPIRVYETATFYTMFNREPVGKYLLQVCGTTPCMLRGAQDIMKACEEELGISGGYETTEDKIFTLVEVECLGACVNAPMIQVNDDFYEDLTPESMKQLLRDLRDGKPTKIGPQNHRKNSEGPMGRTSLKASVEVPPMQDLEASKKAREERLKAQAADAGKK